MPNNRISAKQRAFIIAALSEATPINAVARIFGVAKETVFRVIMETGEALGAYMEREFRELPCARLELDETWSYVGIHGQRMKHFEQPGRGDVWLYCAIDPDTKLVVAHHVGTRKRQDCEEFVERVADRTTGEVQLNSDGLTHYPFAIRAAFSGRRVTHAVEIKKFRNEKFEPANYPTKLKAGVAKIVECERKASIGFPDLRVGTIAHCERVFLSVRQELSRFTRLTLAYSKKIEMHEAAIAMHFGIYNLVRRHSTLGSTPAVAAGIEVKGWTWEDVVAETDRYFKAKEDAEFAKAFELAGI